MIFGYVRVSTAEQASDDRTSLQEQERRCRAIAMMHSATAYDFLVYTDVGISGGVPLKNRPAGKEMLEAAKKGDIIVASKLDRMFRSASDALVTAERLHERGIDLILVDIHSEPIASSGIGKMFFTMASAFAEFERMRIAERMADGRRGKKEKGGHTGGSAPYGFKITGSGREARLEIVPEEQKIIKQAIAFAENLDDDAKQVANELNRMGLKTRVGKPFISTQVRRMIDNRVTA